MVIRRPAPGIKAHVVNGPIRQAEEQGKAPSTPSTSSVKATTTTTTTTTTTGTTTTTAPAETETLARMADAFTRSRPAAMPPTIAPAQGGATTGAKAHDLLASIPKEPFVKKELDAESRLRALVQAGDVKLDASTEPLPDPRRLGMRVRAEVGPRSKELSAVEIAAILGQPGWAEAIAALGPDVCRADQRAPSFLLAAHLARWMEGIYPGATQRDVVESFKSAHPDVAERSPHLDEEFLELLQKSYAFMPAWRTKPKDDVVMGSADDWLAVPAAKDLYAERLSHALSELSEVPLVMPLTQSVGERLARDQRFKAHNVVMVQHMLGQANPFIGAMCEAGLEVDKAEYVGIPYQKNPAVKLTLEKTYGITVGVPPKGDIDAMWQHVGAAIDRAYARHRENGEPILVVDDGGYASRWIAEKYAGEQHLFKVVEQTTRGLTEIKKIDDPQFTIKDVAGSYGKRFESAQVGDAVVMAIRRVLDEVTKTPARKDVLVVGAGKVGLGVAESFKGDGARVTLFDPYLSPLRTKQLQDMGYRVITDKQEALKEKFLVVGCSGHRSIDMSDFVKMSSPVFVASSSSKLVEIDVLGLKELATDKDGTLRRILAAKVNEQETWHYWTQDGRIVTTLADGLPVNFQDVNSIAPELIDHTMALMVLAAGEAVRSEDKGLSPLNAIAQFELQARMEGLSTEPRGAHDLKVRVGDIDWYASEQQWRDVARSPATPPEAVEALVRVLTSRDLDGDPTLYRYEMSPVLLEALESPKALSDATVERVLSSGFLPHIAHLARNPELSEAQAARLVGYLEQALAYVKAGAEGDPPDGVPGPKAGVYDPHGRLQTAHPGVPSSMGFQPDYTKVYGFRPREVTAQLTSILYTHPACPKRVRDAVLANLDEVLGTPSAETIHAVRNPGWSAGELRQILDRAVGVTTRLIPTSAIPERVREADPFLASQLSNEVLTRAEANRNALFAYDLLDALAHHPNADDDVVRGATAHLSFIAESFSADLVLRGMASWRTDPTGAPVPDYDAAPA